MAVVQISKVQVRRGRKNSGTSIPQLASGELGWAIDSQELYIGNGSVAEGAPFVGNTRILTENDNLANEYIYKRDDTTIQTGYDALHPTSRPVNVRLDEFATVKGFGALSNGFDDDYDAIQRALDQLFLNPVNDGTKNGRVILYFDAGTYIITDSLKIPPNATLVGAGKNKTIIKQLSGKPVAVTVSGASSPGIYVTNINQFESSIVDFEEVGLPSNIVISGMTFLQTNVSYSVVELNATKNSLFEDVKFEGKWSTASTVFETETSLKLIAKSSLNTCEGNIFRRCEFFKNSYGVHSDFDISNNIFDDCLFDTLNQGVKFGVISTEIGKEFGPRNNKISSSRFVNINRHGIEVKKGTGNLSQSNTFSNVGNDGGSELVPKHSIIKFDQTGNVSEGDRFERSIALATGIGAAGLAPYISEFQGTLSGNHKFNQQLTLTAAVTPERLFKLGGQNSLSYKIHYYYESSVASIIRSGALTVSLSVETDEVHVSDEYDCFGDTDNSENLKFYGEFVDIDSDSVKETVVINYTNSTTDSRETSLFRFWYEIIS